MRLYLCGQKAFGKAVLEMLLDTAHEIAGVSAPVFRIDGERPDRLRAAAEDAGIAWLPAGQLKVETLPDNIDLILAAHSHDFIGRKTRHKAHLGAIGYHPSLLPLHRGRDAVRWTIRMRERVGGGTVYWLSDNIDAGDIAVQDFCLIYPNDTAETLWRRDLFPLGARLFKQVLGDIERGVLVRLPQDKRLVTWEPSIDRPPLYRPDLAMIGTGLDGYTVVREREALHATTD